MEDEVPLIFVCRDIAGDHVGGPECFCNPVVFSASESLEHIECVMDTANLPN